MKKLLSALLLLTLATMPVLAQTTRIIGKVTDETTGNPLPGANVYLEGTNIGSASDIDGDYILTNVPPGMYTLNVMYIGFELASVDIMVRIGEVIRQNVELKYKVLKGEDVVVTAQAEGQMQAINQQISSNTIQNVVSSAKIQELPEANAAEAVGRLPGVSLQRKGGEGNKVVIRGLSPQYNKISIEGVSMAATDTSNRSVDLSMISPGMLDGIEVSKTAMADQEADRLGGSVNFVLKGASEEPTLKATAQTGYNQLSEEMKNYKYSLSGSRRFLDNRLGIFAQANIERKDRSDNSVFAGYQMVSDTITFANGFGLQDVDRENNRWGGVAVIDWETDQTKIKFSNIYSKIDVETFQRQEYLDVTGRNHSYNGIYWEEDMSILMNSLNIEQYLGPVKMTGGASYTKSETSVPEEIRLEAAEAAAFKQNWTWDDKPIEPTEFYTKTVNDTSRIYATWFRQRDYKVDEDIFSTNINFEWNKAFDFAELTVKIGGKYKHKNREYNNEETRVPLGWNDLDLVRTFLAQEFGLSNYDIAQDFPYWPFIDTDYKASQFMAGNFEINRIPDKDLIIQYYHAIKNLKQVGNQSVSKTVYRDYNASIMNDYWGEEDYYGAYIMPTIKFSDKLTIIPGVRYEHNTTDYMAFHVDNAGKWSDPFPYDTVSAIRNNDHWLPMLHIKYKPLDWFDIRASYTHTLSRPSYDRIAPKWSTWGGNLAWNNISLVPSTSKNIDLFFSFYSTHLGLLTIGGFHKQISDFIYNTTTWVIDSTYLDPDYPETVQPPNSKVYGYINNPNEAELYGLEAEWQSNFWFLPGHLKGIVLSMNYTYTHSNLRYPRVEAVWDYVQHGFIKVKQIVDVVDGSYNARLLDQPTHTFNLTLGYDYKGFGIRGSMQYKSDIFSENNWYEQLRSTTEPLTLFDLKVRQKMPFEGLELFCNVNNISKAIEQSTNNGTGWFTYKGYYGLSADIGLRFEM